MVTNSSFFEGARNAFHASGSEYPSSKVRCSFIAGPLKHAGDIFFQADDGIRARTVTGVQTCALPISVVGLGHVTVEAVGVTRPGGEPLRVAAEMVAHLGRSREEEQHHEAEVVLG